MHRHITPTKTLALNSCCCSLKYNASTLCIDSRAGCLGGTQNGRTYVTKRRKHDEYRVRGWEWRAEGVWRKGGEHKKQMADEREETGHSYGTYDDRFGLRVTETYTERKARTAMHHQWKLTVLTLEQPRHCTQASHSPTLSLAGTCAALCNSISHVCSHTQRQRRWTLMLTVAVQTPTRTNEKQGIQHALWVVHTRDDRQTCRLQDEHFQITVQQGKVFHIFLNLNIYIYLYMNKESVSCSQRNKSIHINTTPKQRWDLARFNATKWNLLTSLSAILFVYSA